MEANYDKDKALKRVVENLPTGELPFNFTDRLMYKIYAEAEKKQKRMARLSYLALILASAGLIGTMIYLLTSYFSFSLFGSLSQIHISEQSVPLFGFYIYIGCIVLALLGLDYWLRRLKQRQEE